MIDGEGFWFRHYNAVRAGHFVAHFLLGDVALLLLSDFPFSLGALDQEMATVIKNLQVLNRSVGVSFVLCTRFCRAFVSLVKHDRKAF